MDLAARACFQPDAAVSTFTKLGAAEKKMGVNIPRFLRTHPLSEARPCGCGPARSAAGFRVVGLFARPTRLPACLSCTAFV